MSLTSRRSLLWIGAVVVLVAGGLVLLRTVQNAGSERPRTSEGGLAEFGSLAGANVLIITLDTTRADRFGCYGYQAIATPTLDRLADEGVLFTRATAVSPITLPSHASILTGLYPREHGVRSNGYFTLGDEHATMAEVLRDAGYQTGAVLASFVLNERFGLAQGFADYDDDLKPADRSDPLLFAERDATEVTDRALAWLSDRTDRPFMLWVHYFDPHSPYQPPSPHRERHPGRPYDGEIAYTDAEMGRLLAGLIRMGLDDDTIVVVVGDHGESLHEKDEATHGYLLYEGTMHVPLVMRCGDRLGGGIERSDRVSQVDVMPTVLAFLGIEPPSGIAGVDLQRTDGEPRVCFGETYEGQMEHGWAALYSVYDDDTKYIHGPAPEMYDLSDDLRERNTILGDEPERAAELHTRLADHFGDELESADAPTPSRSLDSKEMTRLRSLGYTVSSPKGSPRSGQGADPRRMMRLMSEVDRIVFSKPPEERGPEVIAELEALTVRSPDFVPGLRYLGMLRRASGDHAGAMEPLAHAVSLHPDTPDLLLSLADSRARAGQTDQAIADLHVLLAAHPLDAEANLMLGRMWLSSGEPDSALVPLQLATELDPDLTGAADALEQAYANAGRSDELEPLLDALLETHPTSSSVRKAKAVLLFRKGQPDTADEVLREGLRLAPDDPQAVNNLVKFLIARPDAEGRRVAEAAALLDGLPDQVVMSDADLTLTLGKVQGVQGRLDEAVATCRQALDRARQDRRNAVAREARQYLQTLEDARSRAGGR